VAEAEGYNELFVGDVLMNLANGTGTFSLEAKISGDKCSGHAYITRYGASAFGCAGQGGRFEANCTDGRRVMGTYDVLNCESGYGRGHDQDGRLFRFAFGYTNEKAAQVVRSRAEEIRDKPKLPSYRPKVVRKEKGYSTGTGFFVSSDGFLLTNYHVVEDAERISVKLPSGKIYPARYISGDKSNDIAILKVEGAFKPVNLRTDGEVEKGQEVFTLGYPLVSIQGQSQKATFGRVNALSGIQDDVRFIQIDIPIQPGNSGGPVFDSTGQVVAVATATLNQFVALQESGSLPQNVNYAVKVGYSLPLVRTHVSGRVRTGKTPASRPVTELIRTLEESVVLIVAHDEN
jgi:S1-C subfamily serine protease